MPNADCNLVVRHCRHYALQLRMQMRMNNAFDVRSTAPKQSLYMLVSSETVFPSFYRQVSISNILQRFGFFTNHGFAKSSGSFFQSHLIVYQIGMFFRHTVRSR